MIGRHAVPYTVAALASFTSFTIGHSLGAAVLTGGLIRFRIYSAWGLTVLDIAKIAFITSITFWLGNAFLLGGATAYAPEAAALSTICRCGPIARSVWGAVRDRLLSAVAGAAPAHYRPRRAGGSALPSFRFTLVQIAIGALDLTLITLAMYTVLPPTRRSGSSR